MRGGGGGGGGGGGAHPRACPEAFPERACPKLPYSAPPVIHPSLPRFPRRRDDGPTRVRSQPGPTPHLLTCFPHAFLLHPGTCHRVPVPPFHRSTTHTSIHTPHRHPRTPHHPKSSSPSHDPLCGSAQPPSALDSTRPGIPFPHPPTPNADAFESPQRCNAVPHSPVSESLRHCCGAGLGPGGR